MSRAGLGSCKIGFDGIGVEFIDSWNAWGHLTWRIHDLLLWAWFRCETLMERCLHLDCIFSTTLILTATTTLRTLSRGGGGKHELICKNEKRNWLMIILLASQVQRETVAIREQWLAIISSPQSRGGNDWESTPGKYCKATESTISVEFCKEITTSRRGAVSCRPRPSELRLTP